MAPPCHAAGERGSRDEPGTSPFILAKLLQICQVSEQFTGMTHPPVPVLHFLLLAAAIPSFLAKHRGLCSPERSLCQQTPGRCSLSSPSFSHATSSAKKRSFPAMLLAAMDVPWPSHDSMLAVSPIRWEMLHPAPNLGT